MSSKKSRAFQAIWGGCDLSTTGLALGVRAVDGREAYVQTKMRGAVKWHDEPAFQLEQTPRMIAALLDQLQQLEWTFEECTFSFAVRQHDMVLLGEEGQLLMPALSWQCNAAVREVERLRAMGAETTVGRIEPRFILPKLMWTLRQDRKLRSQLVNVMTTGDWIALMLTGKSRLSTSDALSNGLLEQRSKRLAHDAMVKASLKPDWFPPVLQSGRLVGRVSRSAVPGEDVHWTALRQRLASARIVAGLGDNHATGVGCGLEESDFQTIVVSAGTSGTINRVVRPNVELRGHAACFEYYRNRLLLMMLADCCKWYDRYVARFAPEYVGRLDQLNREIENADLSGLRRVLRIGGKEIYPPDWGQLTIGQQAASTQLSIMLELLLLLRAMLDEVPENGPSVTRFVLTGGLSQSTFFRHVFQVGVRHLAPGARVLVSARRGPLRYQTAAYGALLNAMRPSDPRAAATLCPSRNISAPNASTRKYLKYWIQAFGLIDNDD